MELPTRWPGSLSSREARVRADIRLRSMPSCTDRRGGRHSARRRLSNLPGRPPRLERQDPPCLYIATCKTLHGSSYLEPSERMSPRPYSWAFLVILPVGSQSYLEKMNLDLISSCELRDPVPTPEQAASQSIAGAGRPGLPARSRVPRTSGLRSIRRRDVTAAAGRMRRLHPAGKTSAARP